MGLDADAEVARVILAAFRQERPEHHLAKCPEAAVRQADGDAVTLMGGLVCPHREDPYWYEFKDAVSGYVQVPTWTGAVPDDCTCQWSSDSDRGGWYLVTATPDCPAHHVPAGGGESARPRPWWEVEAERAAARQTGG